MKLTAQDLRNKSQVPASRWNFLPQIEFDLGRI
jgi:hypothetical protein